MSGKGINNHFSSTFYTFPILALKVEKNDVDFRLPMPHLSVRKMKTAASWKKNDPILETRKIAL